MNPQPPSPPPPDPSSLSLQDPPSPPQAVPEDDSLGLPGQSDHDAHYDMILCAATAARAHPQLMLPDKPLAPERKKVLDKGPFQSYFTAELRTALRLNNAWVQPFHDEVVRAARACAQLAKEWRRPLKPIEEKAVRMYFTQARVLIDYVRTKVEYDNTIVRYLDPPGDDFIVVARCTDWIPRERNMDFVPTALQAFLLSWHLGHGNTRRFRHANPTVPFDVYFRVVSGSAVGGLDAEGRHPKWGPYIDLLRRARRVHVIGASGFGDGSILGDKMKSHADELFPKLPKIKGAIDEGAQSALLRLLEQLQTEEQLVRQPSQAESEAWWAQVLQNARHYDSRGGQRSSLPRGQQSPWKTEGRLPRPLVKRLP